MDMTVPAAASVSRGDVEQTTATQVLQAYETLLNAGLRGLADDLGRRFLASERHGPQNYALPTIARSDAWRDRKLDGKPAARRR